MSNYKYEFKQEFGDRHFVYNVDLVEDFGHEESQLDGMSSEDMSDLLRDTIRSGFYWMSQFTWSKLDG